MFNGAILTQLQELEKERMMAGNSQPACLNCQQMGVGESLPRFLNVLVINNIVTQHHIHTHPQRLHSAILRAGAISTTLPVSNQRKRPVGLPKGVGGRRLS